MEFGTTYTANTIVNMAEPITLAEYKMLTPQQRKNVLKPALQKLLDDMADDENADNTTDDGTVMGKLNLIIAELKTIKDKYKTYDDEFTRLNKVVDDQNKILSAQQKFLEDIDAENRGKDLIVLGLKESEGEDRDDFTRVLQAVGVDPNQIKVSSIRRLGRRDEENQDKKRPMKVTFEEKSMRNNILKNAKKLKDLDEENPLKKVFLKPDVHPKIRQEEKRLYEVFKSEKAKRDNVGIPVTYDRKARVVKRNGEEIDRFRLSTSFQ